MMDRRTFVRAAALTLLPSAVTGQPSSRVHRIAYLSGSSRDADRTRMAGFRRGLQELGYIEGRNILIEERYAAGNSDLLPDLAKELLGLKADIFVVYGAAAAVPAVKNASSTIPIVFTVSADPIGEGLVSSLARPGGQVTGLSDLHSALVTKRLELVKEVVPALSSIAVVLSGKSRVNHLQLKDIQAAAPLFGVRVASYPVERPESVSAAFDAMAKNRPGAIMVLGDFVLATYRKQIAELAIQKRLATISTTRDAAYDGSMMSYGTNLIELWRRCAVYVDKILKGAKPADLPIEQPTQFELVINQKTARAIGVNVPRAVLMRADRVIE